MAIKTARRHALLKVYAHLARCEWELAAVWRSKQDARPGTALAATFPLLTKLAAARYTTKEDLDGADAGELVTNAALSRQEAEAVLRAVAALP